MWRRWSRCLRRRAGRQFYLLTELTLDVLASLQLGHWDIIKSLQRGQFLQLKHAQTKRYLRADTSQVTDTLLPGLGGDEGIELVSSLNNGHPASVGEAAEVATKLKQTILHLCTKKGQEKKRG